MGLVAQYQLSTFSNPVNGATPIDANTVRGNDNTIKGSFNSHDADATIHVQNGLVASRPAASKAGVMWLATDTGAVYLTLDTGSAWVDLNYLKSSGGTVAGATTFGSTVLVSGVLTLSAKPILSTLTALQAVFSDAAKGLVSNAVTGTGNVVMSASPTFTGTAAFASLTASTAWIDTLPLARAGFGAFSVTTGFTNVIANPLGDYTYTISLYDTGLSGVISQAVFFVKGGGAGPGVLLSSVTTGTTAITWQFASNSIQAKGSTAFGSCQYTYIVS